MSSFLSSLPVDLPQPLDDGGTAHLEGATLPSISLPSTNGKAINMATIKGKCVVYIYPMTGRPDTPLPNGWDAIPGARGCTPQSCSFRNHFKELQKFGADVFGLSVQTSEYQREVRDRLHLPFQLLSDSSLKLKSALQLPTFTIAGMELFKRLTLVIEGGKIKKVFYPIFPPDRNAEDVLIWLRENAAIK